MKAALKLLAGGRLERPRKPVAGDKALSLAKQEALKKSLGAAQWAVMTLRQRQGLEPPPRVWPAQFPPLSTAQVAEGWIRVSPAGESEAPLPQIEASECQPHEFLGHIAQGKVVYQWDLKHLRNQQGVTVATKYVEGVVIPDFVTRVDAAKAAAPYYAARLSKTDLKAVVSLEDLIAKSMEVGE